MQENRRRSSFGVMAAHHWLSPTVIGVLVVGPLAGQAPEGRVMVTGGATTDIQGVRSGGYSLVPSVAFRSRHTHFSLAARGSRYSSGEWSIGGGGALAARVPIAGPVAVGFDGSADYVRTSYDVAFAIAEAAPRAELGVGPVILFGGITVTAARTDLAAPAGGFPLPPFQRASQPIERTAVGPAAGIRAAFGLPDGTALGVGYREERPEIDDAGWTDRTVSAEVGRGAFAVGGSIGRRRAPGERSTFGGVQATVALSPRLSVIAAAQRYPSNRLSGASAGRTIVGGLAVRLGPIRGEGSMPRPAGVARPAPGTSRLAIFAPRAARVEVAGDWNRWTPVPAVRAPNGVWYLDLRLEAGAYRYGFRIDGERWTVPAGVAQVDDGFGGRAAWLVVREGGSTGTTVSSKQEE